MPLRRKVVHIGTGFAVFLPKSWVTLIEERSGFKLTYVTMEVSDSITIKALTSATGRT